VSFNYVPAEVQKVVAEGNTLHFYINDGPVSGVPRHEVATFNTGKDMGKRMQELSNQYIHIEDANGNQIGPW
jgi:hypothetical protein